MLDHCNCSHRNGEHNFGTIWRLWREDNNLSTKYSGPYGQQSTSAQQLTQQGAGGFGSQQTTTVTKTETNNQAMGYGQGYGRK